MAPKFYEPCSAPPSHRISDFCVEVGFGAQLEPKETENAGRGPNLSPRPQPDEEVSMEISFYNLN
jgi:hypothetical protein